MSKEKIYIFDTTLRDGAQTEGVDFSVEDKNKIAKILSNIGVDYIENKDYLEVAEYTPSQFGPKSCSR